MAVPSWYASSNNKVHGSFFKEQFTALDEAGFKVSVAYNEIWPLTRFGKVHEKRGINFEIDENLNTYRYKDYNYFPKNNYMFKSFNKRMDKLYKEIVSKEGKIDIIHAHSCFWAGIAAAYISEKYHIPLVITEHSSLKYAKYCRESYKKYIFRAYKRADALIVVGSGLKKELKTYVNKHIEVIPNMVDLKLFNYKQLNNSDNFCFFSCAFLEEGKGMEDLIEAFTNAFKGENVLLRIGGDGSLKEKLQNVINKLEMNKQIQLLGALSRKQVAEEMQNCNVFVLPSEHETFGVVYIEALACGRPVIGTDNGGAEDIIKDYNGIIAERKNIESIKNALVYMKNNYNIYDHNFISKKTVQDYSKERLIERLKGVYSKLV